MELVAEAEAGRKGGRTVAHLRGRVAKGENDLLKRHSYFRVTGYWREEEKGEEEEQREGYISVTYRLRIGSISVTYR